MDFLSEKIRLDFNSYEDLVSFYRAFDLGGLYYERHHVNPISCGGLDVEENIIKLPYQAHVLAHYLLAKEKEAKGDLLGAHKNYNAVVYCLGSKKKRLFKIPENVIDLVKQSKEAAEARQKAFEFNKHTKFVWKGDEAKKVHETLLQNYFDDGWSLGRGPAYKKKKLGTVWVNKNGSSLQVKKEELSHYISLGYEKGMHISEKLAKARKAMASRNAKAKATLNTKWIHKGEIRKCIEVENLQEFLDDGWILGSGSSTNKGQHWTWSKGYHWWNNGEIEMQAVECPDGFTKGRLRKCK